MRTIALYIILSMMAREAFSQAISATPTDFDLIDASIYVDANDHTVVRKSAELLRDDIARVTGKMLAIVHAPAGGKLIAIGSMEKSQLIQSLVQSGQIPSLEGWEQFRLKRVGNMLVIAGSDRRGTAFGTLDLSRQIGVSPWYWWADVPVEPKKNLYVVQGLDVSDAPKVKYRGIFINDEAPALSGWSKEKFGGFNHRFYSHVFELMLRLKANYLWPAMWGSAFYDDDPANIRVADEYGIVIGTSHHEPMDRAHDEWRRIGKGPWNYEQNKAQLQEFWKTGFQRAWNEKITSVGMRGDGDEPMTRETATELLERIVKNQRQIIEEVSGKPASEAPQLWALYKEVQDYYDKGMRVPDDITLLLCDDNWGNLRKLPRPDSPPRKGGYGIYYHFDYVGGPRNHKWINTTQIIRVWEQMNLAYEHGVNTIWIVNVGDIKPMELPISFWCDYAWNPERMGPQDVPKYTEQWAEAQFGATHAAEIADILTAYTKFNSRRKPELLDDKTYSLAHYNEFAEVTAAYTKLLERAEAVNVSLPPHYRDAYFQLALHPVKAMANLYHLYHQVALNKMAFHQKDPATNRYAQAAKKAFEKDSLITLEYHRLKDGKWNHMMSQTHIGYTSWQQPPVNIMPQVHFLPDSLQQPTAIASPSSSLRRAEVPPREGGKVFFEENGAVSMHAQNFSRAFPIDAWKVLPDLGKFDDAITTFPVTAPENQPTETSPRVEYDFYSYSSGEFTVTAYFSPSLNYYSSPDGLQYGISVGQEAPQIISLNKEDKDSISGIWNRWVAEAVIKKTSRHRIDSPGKHTLHYWKVSSGVVLQKIVVDFGGVQTSYLGPPQTLHQN